MTRYVEAFFRNRWRIILPALLLLCGGAVMVLLMPKQYEAEATIWTETSAYFEDVLNPNPWLTPVQVQSNRFRELIQTDAFARTIVDRTPVGATGTEARKKALVAQIQQKLQVQTSGDHLLWLTFEHTQPSVALAVVQVSIEEYNRVMAERAEQQASQAIALYQERVATYEREIIPRSGQAVADYLERHPEARRTLREGGTVDPAYTLLEQQAQLDRTQYQQYKQRLDQVLTQSQEVQKNQEVAFRVMDAPELKNDGRPTLGKKMILVFAAGGAGLALGYAVIFLVLATELDRTVRYPGDVRRRLGLPVLEVVPEYASAGGSGVRAWARLRKRGGWALRSTPTQASNHIQADRTNGVLKGTRC